ncbi:MAG: hypothetical protein ACI97A_001964 [Planctomycetota bacterium]|jgi:hypothetical protein
MLLQRGAKFGFGPGSLLLLLSKHVINGRSFGAGLSDRCVPLCLAISVDLPHQVTRSFPGSTSQILLHAFACLWWNCHLHDHRSDSVRFFLNGREAISPTTRARFPGDGQAIESIFENVFAKEARRGQATRSTRMKSLH